MRTSASAVSVLCLFVAANAHSQTPSARRQRVIIDVHLHAYPADSAFSNRFPNPLTGKPSSVRNAEEHMRATIAQMKRLNVVKGVVSAGEGTSEVALSWSGAAPDLFVASARCDGGSAPAPYPTPCPDVARLREALVGRRYAALGEIGAQYAGLSLSDPRFEPYLALAEELDIPVGIHTGIGPPGISYLPCCRRFRTALGNPQAIEEALNRHPKLRVYLMHGGLPYTQETIALMKVYPQVYADLAVINWIPPREEFHAHLRALVRAGLAKRLMFGSDQMWWPEAIGMAVEGVESAAFLTEEQKADIFCNNAARFFNWEKPKNPCVSP
jgi:predicted TIM-barrel fold metal-dependent hydrolase